MTLPNVSGEFRVGMDPALRFSPSGMAVTRLRCVASSRKKDDSGEWKDDKTVWVNVLLFGKAAENAAESVTKGDLVTVTGRLQVEEWEDGEGTKRTSVDIVADSFGPSLKWATAKVTRAARSEGGSQPSSSSSEPNPWDTGAPPASQTDEPPF